MQFGTDTIHELVDSVWTTMLGWRVESGEPPANWASGEGFLTGSVRIAGAWKGTVRLDCTKELAREAAAHLLGKAPAAVTNDQVCDVVGELTNILGGNFKALLPPASRLCLPTVVEPGSSHADEPNGRLLCRVAFRCQDRSFKVSIIEHAADVVASAGYTS